MRLLLITLQVVCIALVYIGSSFATGTLVAQYGGGPGAMGALFLTVLQALALGAIFLTVVIPFATVLIATLACAILAGFRFLRWVRWVGIAINIGAVCYCLFGMGGALEEVGRVLKMGFILFFLLNSILFWLIPKRPNVQKSRGIIAWAHLALLSGITLLVVYLIATSQKTDGHGIIMAMLAVYSIPFILNFRATRRITLNGDWKKAILPLLTSAALAALAGAMSPVLAIPIGLSMLLFVGFLEMLFVYPEEYPAQPWRVYLVMLLGRLPQQPVEACREAS